MKLTKQQIDHACSRLNTIAEARIQKAACMFEKPTEPMKLSFDEKYALIASGKSKLLPLNQLRSYTNISDAYIFPSRKAQFDAYEKADAKYKSQIDKISAPIRAEQQRIMDRIIMSGGEEAVAMIEAFAKSK